MMIRLLKPQHIEFLLALRIGHIVLLQRFYMKIHMYIKSLVMQAMVMLLYLQVRL